MSRPNFDRVPVIDAASAAAVAVLGHRPRGSRVSWDELASVGGISLHSVHWNTYRRRVKRDMLRLGVVLHCWAGDAGGWELLTAEDTIHGYPLAKLREAARRVRRAERSVAALPDSQLSVRQRQAKAARLGQLQAARRQAFADLRLAGTLGRPHAAQPRYKPGGV